MKKNKIIMIFSLLFFFVYLFLSRFFVVNAQNTIDCKFSVTPNPILITSSSPENLELSIQTGINNNEINNLIKDYGGDIILRIPRGNGVRDCDSHILTDFSNPGNLLPENQIIFRKFTNYSPNPPVPNTVQCTNTAFSLGTHTYNLIYQRRQGFPTTVVTIPLCNEGSYTVITAPTSTPTLTPTPSPLPEGQRCNITINPKYYNDPNTNITGTITASNQVINFLRNNPQLSYHLNTSVANTFGRYKFPISEDINIEQNDRITLNLGQFDINNEIVSQGITVSLENLLGIQYPCEKDIFYPGATPPELTPTPDPYCFLEIIPESVRCADKTRNCYRLPMCAKYAPSPVPPELLKICSNVVDDPETKELNENALCVACASKDPAGSYIYTAIGCLPTDLNLFIKTYIFSLGMSLAGVTAFLLMLWGSITIMTSQGDPQKLTKGKEIIVSALLGIILIIFSVFIIKVIGVDILKIPGFQ